MPLLCNINAKNIFSKNAPNASLFPHRATFKPSKQFHRTLPRSHNKSHQLESLPKDGFIVQEMKRRSVLLGAPLLFLPVRGCTSGGFYGTGKLFIHDLRLNSSVIHSSGYMK